MYHHELFSEALREPTAVVPYEVGRHLVALFPARAMIEGNDCDFDLTRFAAAGRCRLRRDESFHTQATVAWSDERGILDQPQNAWFEVDWAGHALDVVVMSYNPCEYSAYHWIIAETEAIARDFYRAVCSFDPEVRDEVLVFDGGRWTESGRLFDQIGGSTLENLVLPEKLKGAITADVDRFFRSRSAYDRHGAPWKRGLLFIGPPGNGKTHALKALVNASGRPCLYVKSFKSERWCESTSIRRAFERARKASPCFLILEDLDALITDENRSFFLNEMDGFAANVGILTIATTNHPARLDPAILDRPSRFDRKYHFHLPDPDSRRAYIARWNATLEPEARLTADGIELAMIGSEGFSFAYLKELFLSAIMAWIAEGEAEPMDRIIAAQVEQLAEGMQTSGSGGGTKS